MHYYRKEGDLLEQLMRWLKKGAGLHDHQGKLNRDKTTYKKAHVLRYCQTIKVLTGFLQQISNMIRFSDTCAIIRRDGV